MSPPPRALPGEPSAWVQRFAPLIRPGGSVLDYACGCGRHARWLAGQGLRVVATDRNAAALHGLRDLMGIDLVAADLENGSWPFEGRSFDAIVVTNYLFRPRLALLLECLQPGGLLIYETFMHGNERFGKPANPAFLLAPGELLERLGDGYTVVAFEQGEVADPRPAMIQRVCAIRGVGMVGILPQP